MKILQLTVHYAPNVGGVETHLEDLVRGLSQNGHDVFVLTYRPLMTKASWKIFETRSSIKILRLPWFPGFFYNLVRHPAVEFFYLVPGLFIATPFAILVSHSEVIHSHGLVAGFIGVFWSKIFRKKVVVSTHSIYHFPQKGLYTVFVSWIFKNATTTLCLSNQSVAEIRRLGVAEDKVKRFTYWIDTNHFRPLDKNSLKKRFGWQNKFVVLFIGRLVGEKGINELLKASKELPQSIIVVIVGDGPLKEDIQKEADHLPVVSFIGKVDNSKLVNYYNAADVLIVPSIHEEGFGRVILESLACGMPVIGANIGGIPEAMDESVGRLIEVSSKSIAKEITNLQTNRALYEKLCKNARAFAEKKYSVRNIEPIISVYK